MSLRCLHGVQWKWKSVHPVLKLETDRLNGNGQSLKHQIKEDGQSLARKEWTSKMNLGHRVDFRSLGMDKK